MKHIPERMCVGCRKKTAKSDLIRIVQTADGICVDKKQNITARGVYICKNVQCIALAKKKKALSRQFRQGIADSVYDGLAKELENE
ncbi:MAG: YlxR family protein [Clostridia bacterium]|nr:YlxR family protein [Clostridia bacterium]